MRWRGASFGAGNGSLLRAYQGLGLAPATALIAALNHVPNYPISVETCVETNMLPCAKSLLLHWHHAKLNATLNGKHQVFSGALPTHPWPNLAVTLLLSLLCNADQVESDSTHNIDDASVNDSQIDAQPMA